jgi:hypothetical protein
LELQKLVRAVGAAGHDLKRLIETLQERPAAEPARVEEVLQALRETSIEIVAIVRRAV